MKMKGIAASPGIVIGKVLILNKEKSDVKKETISKDRIKDEIEKLHNAVEKAKKEIKIIKDNIEKEIGEERAKIFDAHMMMLDDPELISAFETKIREGKFSAPAAVKQVIEQYAKMFDAMEDEYLKMRGADIKDIGKRVINILLGNKEIPDALDKEVIIVAKELSPSSIAQLDTKKVLAFVTKDGSRTSHASIIARSLGIPAVVGLGETLLDKVQNNSLLIVDGNSGEVYLDPDKDTLEIYKQKIIEYKTELERLAVYSNKKAKTKDGIAIEVVGNIGNIDDLEAVLVNGGEGIGLFRTEFLYMNRAEIPSEEEQFEVYKKVAEKIEKNRVVIRTLDIGADKEVPYLGLPKEMNPFLGYRGIRICLDKTDIFKSQLRAILRASKYGNLSVMFPMISSLDEVKEAKDIFNEVKMELDNESVEYNENIEIGIMVETPAAVTIADILAEEVDFFSIGTNDLIQYTLAVDRTNEKVADLYSAYHPAILRLIKKIIDEGHKAGIWVGMCGEAAGDELLLPFLLGTGLDEFSMSALSIPKIKESLEKWTKKDAEKEMENILELKTTREVKNYLQKVKR